MFLMLVLNQKLQLKLLKLRTKLVNKTIDFKITIFKFLFVLIGIQCPLDCPLSQNCNLGRGQKLIYALPLIIIDIQRVLLSVRLRSNYSYIAPYQTLSTQMIAFCSLSFAFFCYWHALPLWAFDRVSYRTQNNVLKSSVNVQKWFFLIIV